jgi:hypothetical protein
MILIEVFEEAAGADRVSGDFQVVNMLVPVRAHLLCRRHG